MSFFLVAGVLYAASTIGANMLTTGTLQVDSTATFNGNSTFGNASTDVNLFKGTLQASTTALFSSGLTAYGSASTTLNEEGTAGTDFRVESDSQAYMLYVESTINAVGVATSSPTQEFSVVGDIHAGSAATTTLTLSSSAAVTGGCIQLEGTNGVMYRIYATSSGPLVTVVGSCQ